MGSPFGDHCPSGAFGRKPNICVPALNPVNMNQVKNPVIDEKLISLICNLVCSSSSDRMSLKDSNNILKNLFRQYSPFHDLFIYNSYSDFQLNSNQNVDFTNIGFYLGQRYREGRGTEKDYSKAFKYYKLTTKKLKDNQLVLVSLDIRK